MATCVFCDRPVKGRGLCANHYTQVRNEGTLAEFPLDHQPLAGRLCSVPGCGKPAKTRLYCSMHAERARKTGDPGEVAPRKAVPGRRCDAPGCDRMAHRRGHCFMHAHRIARLGEPGPAEPLVGERGAGHVDKNGYRSFMTEHGREFEHRIVWRAANGEIPPGYCIHHVNGDRLDNRLENLEMLTNTEHAHRHDALNTWRASREKE